MAVVLICCVDANAVPRHLQPLSPPPFNCTVFCCEQRLSLHTLFLRSVGKMSEYITIIHKDLQIIILEDHVCKIVNGTCQALDVPNMYVQC